MAAESLTRPNPPLQLAGVIAGDRNAATTRIRDAFSEAGAWITDVHFFSGLQTTFAFEVAADRVRAFEAALVAAGLTLDATSHASLGAAANTPGELQGTLAVTFKDGDPELKHEVPAVPG